MGITNGQLVGKRFELAKESIPSIFRRAGTFLGLIVCGLGTYLLLLPRLDDSQKPLAIAISVLVFMGPTILAYGRIMGASWNMLMIGKFRTWLGRLIQ